MEDRTNRNQPPLRAALYARVSSDQQTQQCTIASQVEALKERMQADSLPIEDELCFVDDGYTGSTLVRPALERLRDVAWAGGFQRLYVHSPDRLVQVRLAGVVAGGTSAQWCRGGFSEPLDRR